MTTRNDKLTRNDNHRKFNLNTNNSQETMGVTTLRTPIFDNLTFDHSTFDYLTFDYFGDLTCDMIGDLKSPNETSRTKFSTMS